MRPELQGPLRPGNPWQLAEGFIAADELQRAALALAHGLRLERGLTKAQHGSMLLDGLTAGRRGRAAIRAWIDKLRAEAKPVQASLL